jgi:hypothetical protein
VPEVPEHLRLAGEATARPASTSRHRARRVNQTMAEQYAVLVTCRDEAQRIELLARFHAEGLDCRTLLSRRGAV